MIIILSRYYFKNLQLFGHWNYFNGNIYTIYSIDMNREGEGEREKARIARREKKTDCGMELKWMRRLKCVFTMNTSFVFRIGNSDWVFSTNRSVDEYLFKPTHIQKNPIKFEQKTIVYFDAVAQVLIFFHFW